MMIYNPVILTNRLLAMQRITDAVYVLNTGILMPLKSGCYSAYYTEFFSTA